MVTWIVGIIVVLILIYLLVTFGWIIALVALIAGAIFLIKLFWPYSLIFIAILVFFFARSFARYCAEEKERQKKEIEKQKNYSAFLSWIDTVRVATMSEIPHSIKIDTGDVNKAVQEDHIYCTGDHLILSIKVLLPFVSLLEKKGAVTQSEFYEMCKKNFPQGDLWLADIALEYMLKKESIEKILLNSDGVILYRCKHLKPECELITKEISLD